MTKNNPMQQFFSPYNLKSGDFVRTVFRHQLEQHFTKEDLLNCEKWRQIAKSHPALKAGDIVEVLREDNAFFAVLLITGKIDDNIFVKILSFNNLEEDAAEDAAKASDFEITWKGPVKKFTITRIQDKREIKDKFSSKDEARYHLKNNY